MMKSFMHLSVVIVLLSLFSIGDCIRWHMIPNTHKCLREELRKDVLVIGVYEVNPIEGQQIDYVVKDSSNHILSQKEDITSGKFTFSVENVDTFEICFISKIAYGGSKLKMSSTTPSEINYSWQSEEEIPGSQQEVFLDIKIGVEAKNYEGIAEVSKLKPLELDLKRLEDLSVDIVSDFDDMRKRADELRDTNESTKKRILYFGIFSISCLLIFATWQLIYLRRYFKAKKLIE